MKTLYLAAATVLALGAGSAWAEGGATFEWNEAPATPIVHVTTTATKAIATTAASGPVGSGYATEFNGNG